MSATGHVARPDRAATGPVLAAVTGLTVRAPDGTTVLDGGSLTLRAGRITALTGPSGSGKTTLLRSLLGHVPAGTVRESGTVDVGGTDPFALGRRDLQTLRRERLAFVGQDPGAALNPTMRVRTLLTEVAADRYRAAPEALLDLVSLPHPHLHRRPGRLSGGEQRRVAIARALGREVPVLLIDEPLAGLDPRLRDGIAALLRRLTDDLGLAVAVSGHDAGALHALADDVVDLSPAAPARPAPLQSAPLPPASLRPAQIPPAPLPPAPLPPAPLPPAPLRPAAGGTAGGGTELGRPESGRTAPSGTETGQTEPNQTRTDGTGSGAANRDVLSATSLTATVGRGRTPLLHDVDLRVEAGRAVAVIGPSGAGKTTLARVLVGLHPAGSGEITLHGDRVHRRASRRAPDVARRIAWVPQDPLSTLNPSRTVGATLARPLARHRVVDRAARGERVRELLGAVGLPAEFGGRYPHELSGGQRQRVAIARALATDPDVLICDEITSALDADTAGSVLDLLAAQRARRGLGFVLITHRMALVRRHCHTVTVVSGGTVVEAGPTAAVFDDPRHPATRELLAAEAGQS